MAGSKRAAKHRHSEAEERLLIEAAQRDPSCFADLYEDYFEIVYAYVARRVRSRDEAEELTSEVFHKALASLPRFRWTGAPFAAWLFRIASNMIADRAKRAARDGNTSGYRSRAAAVEDRARQHTSLEAVERHARLFRVVSELAEDQRRVVLMRFAEEKSIREIANELERSEGAVKQLQFRALENLRRRITDG
jgi:RNA polymerase sigma-70 factor (ECF subfamily)